ncbi:hypothetical protein MNEG_2936 [Monoraphidium neglectum]|uniref:CBM20 domain-containing protein n=1 Tax=Monoraphidium neglectum TaxID=145388 RepID=A0A0D2MX73_9CHLO|nr:hypothetical protein MNEG_2936 [Monoraphidium neglectum]KIZ05022.1 hypothetical protein MNEG_2936 [Monoraphidium neglectum]|eukprot:XP_013904041.1 hypothetical protein MNEG_2936 [Monoraphidium neglectum]
MVGSNELLGNWDPKRGMGMRWSEGDVWVADFEVPPGPHLEMEYKYVVRNADGGVSHWKPGSNFSFSLSSVAPLVLARGGPRGAQLGGVAVRDAWDGARRDVSVEFAEDSGLSEEERREQDAFRESLSAALEELSGHITQAEQLSRRIKDPASPHLLEADRMVAAATRKAVAFAQALNASISWSALSEQA